MNDALNIYNKLPFEIFDTVINESTWGSSKYGGPVWVMDFRISTLKERFTAGTPKEYFDAAPEYHLSRLLAQMATEYVYCHRLCNVLIVSDSDATNTRTAFFSLLSFGKLLCELLETKDKPKDAPRRLEIGSAVFLILSIWHRDFFPKKYWDMDTNYR